MRVGHTWSLKRRLIELMATLLLEQSEHIGSLYTREKKKRAIDSARSILYETSVRLFYPHCL
jgi:hypothetical protein